MRPLIRQRHSPIQILDIIVYLRNGGNPVAVLTYDERAGRVEEVSRPVAVVLLCSLAQAPNNSLCDSDVVDVCGICSSIHTYIHTSINRLSLSLSLSIDAYYPLQSR